jgi:hypothetical protein
MGSIPGKVKRFFSSPQRSEWLWDPLNLLYIWVPGGPLSAEKNQPESEADHSPPSSTEVKKDGAIPPLPIHRHDVFVN